ncbi:helix-turn-helix domain-containing protein [Campylobacter sp. VBCF_06 NA8]|uniref:helix-turn-helix domain-containing protein n=1 Tax=Campylobacter sp. VBCF_06 NA8 TaxID=2983822 RepID=UPI0022E99AB6|nr:helix-turn-helix domain-containing protein [Campylobacter sp. VBCF_06 NA8]MDA3046725.1 helix-turn-helix domain-containing protein [Campylobacter sp. VBCF_06 NA8]
MDLEILRRTDLSDFAKIIFFEISALTNNENFCFAKTEYFCRTYKKSRRHIQRVLKELTDLKIITIFSVGNNRKIYINLQNQADKNVTDKNVTLGQKCHTEGDKNVTPYPIINLKLNNNNLFRENLNFKQSENEKNFAENEIAEFGKKQNSTNSQIKSDQPNPQTQISNEPYQPLATSEINLPDFINPEIWEMWEEYKRSRKEPLSAMQRDLLINDTCKKLHEKGYDINEAIKHSIASGYKAIYPAPLTKPAPKLNENGEEVGAAGLPLSKMSDNGQKSLKNLINWGKKWDKPDENGAPKEASDENSSKGEVL